MFRLVVLSLLSISFFLGACTSEHKMSDSDQISENVKNYFFLSDSINVDVQITDTLYSDEVEELIARVDKNLNLVDQDLDTLSLMIDDLAYRKLAYEKRAEEVILLRKIKYQDSIKSAEFVLMNYQLKQSQLSSKRTSYKQTQRVLLHLKRSIWANVAGFNIVANYVAEDDSLNFTLLLDANFNVVD